MSIRDSADYQELYKKYEIKFHETFDPFTSPNTRWIELSEDGKDHWIHTRVVRQMINSQSDEFLLNEIPAYLGITNKINYSF